MELTNEQIAIICHETCRAYQIALGEEYPHGHWSESTKLTQELTIRGVELNREGKSAREIHGDWVESRKHEGWTLGRKSDAYRTHPNLVPYEQLPEKERYKNALQKAVFDVLTNPLNDGVEETDAQEVDHG